jgi:predicted nucleic acid-binding protein
LIVVDTNVIAYRFVEGEHTAAALALVARDADWHSPWLWRSEFCNVLVGEMRAGRLVAAGAREAMRKAMQSMGASSHGVSPLDVLELAQAHRCTAYDLEFVALARQLEAPLFTLDRALLRAFPGLAEPLA